ncbi:MAG: hypothetical protein JJE25_06650, partial [Bacteroidia bacterium]|nr:hypothetical protein [Bacteroidia bacterium]
MSILIYRLKIFSLPNISKRWVILAFIIKIGAGAALGFLYTHHYTDRMKADTFKFFDDSGVLLDALAVNPRHFFELLTGIGLDDPELEPYFFKMNTWLTEDFYITSNRMMIRLNLMFRFLTPPGEHYYVHVVLINFLSLLGLIFLCKAFFLKLKQHNKLFLLSLILFPSVLFWGSGLLKDGIIIFALGSMMYSFSRMLNGYKHKWLSGFVFAMSALLLALIKIYILFAMIPALAGWIWCSFRPQRIKTKFIITHLACFLIVALAHVTSLKFDPVHYLNQKQLEFFKVVESEKPNHVI